tara:strand:+ start:293 stop:523 length:231 start_codon:yes stop_codon:yes gene_type:complete
LKPELIASDEHQKMLRFDEATVIVSWSTIANCYEAAIYKKTLNKYGELVNEYITAVTAPTEERAIKEAHVICIDKI